MSFINRKTRSKPKAKQKLSRLQEGRVIKIAIALLFLSLLWIIFAPGSGVVTLLNKRADLDTLQQDTAEIQQQIDQIKTDIDRLHNDQDYLEKVARKDFGLLKENEKVYDFSKTKPQKPKRKQLETTE